MGVHSSEAFETAMGHFQQHSEGEEAHTVEYELAEEDEQDFDESEPLAEPMEEDSPGDGESSDGSEYGTPHPPIFANSEDYEPTRALSDLKLREKKFFSPLPLEVLPGAVQAAINSSDFLTRFFLVCWFLLALLI